MGSYSQLPGQTFGSSTATPAASDSGCAPRARAGAQIWQRLLCCQHSAASFARGEVGSLWALPWFHKGPTPHSPQLAGGLPGVGVVDGRHQLGPLLREHGHGRAQQGPGEGRKGLSVTLSVTLSSLGFLQRLPPASRDPLPAALQVARDTVYVAGTMSGTATFGASIFTAASTNGFLLQCIRTTGDVNWGQTVSSSGKSNISALAIDDTAREMERAAGARAVNPHLHC